MGDLRLWYQITVGWPALDASGELSLRELELYSPIPNSANCNSASTELRAVMLRLINDNQRRLVKPDARSGRKPRRPKRGN